jgi:hypothetical protein
MKSQKPARQQGLLKELPPSEEGDQNNQECNDDRRN